MKKITKKSLSLLLTVILLLLSAESFYAVASGQNNEANEEYESGLIGGAPLRTYIPGLIEGGNIEDLESAEISKDAPPEEPLNSALNIDESFVGDSANFSTGDVYNPGYYAKIIDVIKYANTAETITTDVPGTVTWFSSNRDVVEVVSYNSSACNVRYKQAGTAKLTLSYTFQQSQLRFVDKKWELIYVTCNTQIIMNVTVKTALPENNTQHFAGGSGTAANPYLISTKQHLANINKDMAYLKAYYKLMNDIVFDDADFKEDGDFYSDGLGWWSIGTTRYWSTGSWKNGSYSSSYCFSGVFDGNGFTISGLYGGYVGTGPLAVSCVGLFGANLGTIKNLGIENSEFQAFSRNRSEGYATVGFIAGLNAGTISNCYVRNSYIAGDVAGGIAGEMLGGSITDCYTGNCKFTLTPALIPKTFHMHGGIVGNLCSGTVNRTYGSNFIYAIAIDGEEYYPTSIGGIAGQVDRGYSSVTNSYYLDFIPNGVYALGTSNPNVTPKTVSTVKLSWADMTNLSKFTNFSSTIWYINSSDYYTFPQLKSFQRIKRALTVFNMPEKTVYKINEKLDLTDLSLTLVLPNGSFETISVSDVSVVYSAPGNIVERDTVYIDGFDSKTIGTKLLTLYYSDLTTQFEVYVIDDQIDAKPTLYGDVNGDGKVNIADLICLSRHIANIAKITDADLLKAANVNGSGTVDISDLVRLAQWIAEINTTPLGQP